MGETTVNRREWLLLSSNGFGATAGLLFVWFAATSGLRAAPVPQFEPIIKVQIHLDKSEVVPGETVTILESMPAECEVKIRAISRTVTKIGGYDTKSNGLINFKPKHYESDFAGLCDSKEAFLPMITGFSKPRLLPLVDKNRRGKATEFKPVRLGIYLIQSSMSIPGEPDWQSPPLVLIVRPPVDKNGHDIVKPEWLDRN